MKKCAYTKDIRKLNIKRKHFFQMVTANARTIRPLIRKIKNDNYFVMNREIIIPIIKTLKPMIERKKKEEEIFLMKTDEFILHTNKFYHDSNLYGERPFLGKNSKFKAQEQFLHKPSRHRRQVTLPDLPCSNVRFFPMQFGQTRGIPVPGRMPSFKSKYKKQYLSSKLALS